MSTSTEENLIFDFELSENERDLIRSVPKLQGESNWRAWEANLFTALGCNYPICVWLIKDQFKMPPAPVYDDPSHASVKALLFEEATGNKEMENNITEDAIEARSIEIVASNLSLRERHADDEEKWATANARASFYLRSTVGPEALSMIFYIPNVREAYLKLKTVYWSPSHHAIYRRFKKLDHLRYRKGDPETFVVRFQKILGDYTAFVGKMTPLQELCHFKRAIIGSPRCRVFIPSLRVNEEDPDLMNQVYRDFVTAVRIFQTLPKSR
ncbi:uncharacterized protein N7500_002591 [Penicillium coprophilum]|uniref:uncharacterized protein n=1 Tax=Penicillium coprophilum TaxID=36646 RepID=UPI00238829BB|nr:uncharacterized protein N7500_002591 [Penicillium coprophilum]KAJ5169808.1 hypothetical protein N7500_002591 [Penicillium coprophilum]